MSEQVSFSFVGLVWAFAFLCWVCLHGVLFAHEAFKSCMFGVTGMAILKKV